MTTLAVYDIGNQKVSDIELDDQVFGAKINPSLFCDVVRRDLASQRKGTAATKNRTLVRGGGAKPWRQKGTGRARAGSRRSPLWRGGGTIFGPMPRGYSFSLPKKVKRAALKAALSLKRQDGKLILLNDFPLEGFKTRQVLEVLRRFQVEDAFSLARYRGAYPSQVDIPSLIGSAPDADPASKNIRTIIPTIQLFFISGSLLI